MLKPITLSICLAASGLWLATAASAQQQGQIMAQPQGGSPGGGGEVNQNAGGHTGSDEEGHAGSLGGCVGANSGTCSTQGTGQQ